MNGVKKSSITQIILMGIVVILLILYAFTISHVDCNTITTWAYDLLESIRKGELTNYPVYTYTTHNMATNYSLVSNVVNAIWLAPIYIIDSIGGLGLSMIVYDIWYKGLIFFVSIICIFLMKKVLTELNIEADKKLIGVFIVGTSAVLLLPVLGKGQIDVFDMMLVILCMHLYLKKKITMSFLCLGIGVVFKPFILLLGIPYLLLMIGRCKKKSIVNTIYLFVPYVCDYIITKLVMPRYSEMKKITSEEFAEMFGMSRVEQVFNIKINSIYVFLAITIVICSICLYIGIQNKTKERHLLMFPACLFLAFEIFVEPAAVYWIAVLIPLLVVMGMQSKNLMYWLLLNFGINVGIVGYIIFGERVFAPGKSNTLLNGLVNVERRTYIAEILGSIKYMGGIFVTIYIVSMLLICIEFFYERKMQKEGIADTCRHIEILENKMIWLLLGCQIVPQIIYLILAYIFY